MNFWDVRFDKFNTMWGLEPTDSSIKTKDFFLKQNIKDILIPGIGYGRNAKPFIENNIEVTGIEISQSAIDLAKKLGLDIPIHHGSVSEMPFDDKKYEGIYCYALLHLLNEADRKKFIKASFEQLKPGGYMIFYTVSKKDTMYGEGIKIDENTYKRGPDIEMFFYDEKAMIHDFSPYGLIRCEEYFEPYKNDPTGSGIWFSKVICQKQK